MLGRCQSTGTAKIFYQQLPGCPILCAWHKLPCEEHRLLLVPCQKPAANQGAEMEKCELIISPDWLGLEEAWGHLLCDWMGLKSVENLHLSFPPVPAVPRDVTLCRCVQTWLFVRHILIACNTICEYICVDWLNLLYSMMCKHRWPHPAQYWKTQHSWEWVTVTSQMRWCW